MRKFIYYVLGRNILELPPQYMPHTKVILNIAFMLIYLLSFIQFFFNYTILYSYIYIY